MKHRAVHIPRCEERQLHRPGERKVGFSKCLDGSGVRAELSRAVDRARTGGSNILRGSGTSEEKGREQMASCSDSTNLCYIAPAQIFHKA